MKVSELSGAQLDWAVAQAEGEEVVFEDGELCLPSSYFKDGDPYKPSEDWAQGGLIIEREAINTEWTGIPNAQWFASMESENLEAHGETPLIAAMRCYVASKLGDEIYLPVEIRGHDQDCSAIDGFGCKCEEA